MIIPPILTTSVTLTFLFKRLGVCTVKGLDLWTRFIPLCAWSMPKNETSIVTVQRSYLSRNLKVTPLCSIRVVWKPSFGQTSSSVSSWSVAWSLWPSREPSRLGDWTECGKSTRTLNGWTSLSTCKVAMNGTKLNRAILLFSYITK